MYTVLLAADPMYYSGIGGCECSFFVVSCILDQLATPYIHMRYIWDHFQYAHMYMPCQGFDLDSKWSETKITWATRATTNGLVGCTQADMAMFAITGESMATATCTCNTIFILYVHMYRYKGYGSND